MKLRRKLISEESPRTKKSTIRFTPGFIFIILISLSLFLTTCKESTEPEEIVGWQKHPNNPVLEPGEAGEWDDAYVGCPSVIFYGEIYHMFYVGGDGTNFRIGLATSADGILWGKHPDNPVLDVGSEGSWDDYWVLFPSVKIVWSTYGMWYHGNDGTTDRIGYATSSDGISWTKAQENPILEPGVEGSWDDTHVSTPFETLGGILYYAGSDGDYFKIGYASRVDIMAWAKNPENPVLDIGPQGSWEYPRIQDPRIVYDGYNSPNYHMWYSGGGFFTWRIGQATSDDGVTWTKDPNNPVLDVGKSGEWDDAYVGGCSVILEDNWKMWYTGGKGFMQGNIGYATKK